MLWYNKQTLIVPQQRNNDFSLDSKKQRLWAWKKVEEEERRKEK